MSYDYGQKSQTVSLFKVFSGALACEFDCKTYLGIPTRYWKPQKPLNWPGRLRTVLSFLDFSSICLWCFCSNLHVWGIRFSLCTYSRMVLGQILHKKSLALMFQYLIENKIFFNLFDWENLPNMEIFVSLIDARICQLALSLFASQKIEKNISWYFPTF